MRIIAIHISSFYLRLLAPVILLLFIASIDVWGQEKENDIDNMVSKIDTSIDPAFIYEYEQTKFVPPPGKTLLIMGQTIERINEYLEKYPDQQKPGGWAAYWGIPEFKGITDSYQNVPGNTQNHQFLVEQFPNTVVQSALWMVGTWDVAKKAGKGEYDDVVRQFSDWAKSARRPIYLRIGYEFDGPHNELEPKDYKKAYRRIVDILREEGADNIAFVWHSYAAPTFKGNPLSEWYPGDDYVDWVGISVFGHAYGEDFGRYCNHVLDFARLHKKPVMIAESNPIHGIDKEHPEVWDQWFVNYFSFIYSKNIKAVSFINENWPDTGIPGISDWKDGRLYNNRKVSAAWFEETNKERYLKQSPELYEQLGYSEKK